MSGEIGDPLKFSRFNNKTLTLILTLCFAFYAVFVSQTSVSLATSSGILNSTPSPDFTITASLPSVVPADGTTPATSTIILNPIGRFAGTVILSDAPLPADIRCKAIDPLSIPYALGMAMLSCTSSIAGTYAVAITGASDEISHNTTRTFTFAASPPPDFTIVTVSTVSFNSGSTAASNVTVTPQGGFSSRVNLTAIVYPSSGLAVFLTPQFLPFGSGLSTATFSSSSLGDYTVQIMGTSKLVWHTIRVNVAVTPASIPDFRLSPSASSIDIEAGSQGTARILVTPDNGFASAVSITVVTPAEIKCSLSPTSLQSSGETTLTCNGSIAGDYTATITATGGGVSHTTTINLHVGAATPAAPVPTNTPGISLTAFYGIMGTITVIVATVALLVMKRSQRSATQLPDAQA